MDTRDKFADENKQRARETIWRVLAHSKHPPLAVALMLPGSERFEIETALARGFKLEQLYLVERSAAVLANLTRRSRDRPLPPKANILRMPLSQAAEILLKRKVRIDVAHLDFCSHCEAEDMIEETRAFVQSGVMADRSLLAVTILAGREHAIDTIKGGGIGFTVEYYDEQGRAIADAFGRLSLGDRGRLRRVWEAVGTRITIRQIGRYHNKRTNNPMLWTDRKSVV